MKQTATATHSLANSSRAANRRRTRRVAISQPITARPRHCLTANFEELRATVNVSVGGLYFRTWRATYRKGMDLIVTCLPSSPNGGLALEYLARVARVESLEGYRFGVAVELLAPLGAIPFARSRRSSNS